MHRRTDQADAFAFIAERLRRQQDADLMAALRGQAGKHHAPDPKPKSRFDGPNVIDLVRGADGTYSVPEAHLRDVRAL